MKKKSIYLAPFMLAFAFSPKANAAVDFQNYTPTIDKEKIEGAQSAYVLTYQKTDEANADFSTYEKLANGEWTKVYYKYSTSIKSGVVSETRKDVSAGTVLPNQYGAYINQNITKDSVLTSGGAIENNGEFANLYGDFIGNSAIKIQAMYDVRGGAIYNANKIGNIYGDFISNYVDNNTPDSFGGAIYNSGSIQDLHSNFIGNSANGIFTYGGAIYNSGIIKDIYGAFIGNSAKATASRSFGGAIYNRGTIGNINADFAGNYTNGYYEKFGAGIYNAGTIGDITGDFVNNAGNSGTAIYNTGGSIGNIRGNFIKANGIDTNFSAGAYGGAIYNANNSSIKDITGDFYGNVLMTSGFSRGGAIYNANSTISNIYGNFLYNRVETPNSSWAMGGAIYNGDNGIIGNIQGNFIGNIVKSKDAGSSGAGEGAAIYNSGTIGKITGDFINNESTTDGNAQGGVIRNTNTGSIGDIKGSFVENKVYGSYLQGGLIYNEGTMQNITGDFLNNEITGKISYNPIYTSGGIVKNSGKIDTIEGNFSGNILKNLGFVEGGIITNYGNGSINKIKGNFTNNKIYSSNSSVHGGILGNNGSDVKIDTIHGDFIGNEIYSETDNVGDIAGGAIYSIREIGEVRGNFSQNKFISETLNIRGGVVYNGYMGIKNLYGSFTNNQIEGGDKILGGVIFYDVDSSMSSPLNFTGDILNNSIVLHHKAGGNNFVVGAAIASNGTINLNTTQEKKSITIANNKYTIKNGTVSSPSKLNSIDFISDDAKLNINTLENTYVDIRDPMRSIDQNGQFINSSTSQRYTYGEINKVGSGVLSLWGDNSEYYGDLNIVGGTFYAMYDDVQDKVNDASGQRMKFDMSNAVVSFADGTVFRPKVSSNQIANIGNNATVTGTSQLRPYNVSSLNAGTHSYNVDYSKFQGFESDLLKVDSQGGKTDVVIKRDLAGYNGLTSFADVYRKRQNLSQTDREMYDNIYYNGKVENSEKEVLNTISGEDTRAFQELHKASIRQFNRQISSRIQNKDCPSCGMLEGFSDQHLWFNVGQNWVEKENRGNILGYDYSPTSLAWGYDYDVIPNALTLGVAISYAYGDVKGKGGSSIYSRSEVDEYLASMYWKYKPLRAYTTGSIGGGVIQNKTKLATDSVNTRGEYDTGVVFSSVEFGYDFGNACYVFEPFVGADYSYMVAEAYDEKGEGARHFDKNKYNTLELPIGFRVSRNMVWDSFIFTPAFELAYARNVGDRNVSVNSYFVGSPESPWAVVGNPDDRDSIRSKVNMKINNIYIPFAFNVGYARDTRAHYTDDQLYLTVRYNF